MHSQEVFITLGIILFVAVLLGSIFIRLKQSIITAYLLGGILIGPDGFNFVPRAEQINILSEVGLILLMFILGLSFPPRQIANLGIRFLLAGLLQVSSIVFIVFGLGVTLGLGLSTSVLLGTMIVMSSTAIVVKILNDSSQTSTKHGRFMIASLIIQDIIAIFVIAVLSGLDKADGIVFDSSFAWIFSSVIWILVKGISFFALVMLIQRRLSAKIQRWMAESGSRELFLLGTLLFCLGMSLLGQTIGLSFSFGAFMAGLIISESDYNFQVLAGMIPFRDAFLCIFFVSLGMLLNPMILMEEAGSLSLLLVAMIVGKGILVVITAWISGFSPGASLLAGAGLAHVGEFSFIIGHLALSRGFMEDRIYNLVLTASLLSMMTTPFIVKFFPRLLNKLRRLPYAQNVFALRQDKIHIHQDFSRFLTDHVVICGFGSIGVTIGKILSDREIPYIALDMDGGRVKNMTDLDLRCFYGDAASPEVMQKIHIETACMAIVTISQLSDSETVVKNIKALSPNCFVLARARFIREEEELYNYGADMVVQERFETGLSMLSAALDRLKIGKEEVETQIQSLRTERDKILRRAYLKSLVISRLLSPRHIVYLKTGTKEQVVRELVTALTRIHSLDEEEIFKVVMEREAMENTALEGGLALPHARSHNAEGVHAILGLSPQGIDYDQEGREPIRVIFLVIADHASDKGYLNALSSFSSVFHNEFFCNSLLRTTQAEQVLHLIKAREKVLIKMNSGTF